MSKIQWTNETWNPIAGCSKISPGCTNCYAIKDAHRLSGNPNPKISSKYAGTTKNKNGKLNWTGRINLAREEVLTQPLRWTKPRMIFVNSMSDLFHENVSDEWIDKLFAVMALSQQHTFQILTKRPERMRDYFDRFRRDIHPNYYWAKQSFEMGLADSDIKLFNIGAFTNSLCEVLRNVHLYTSVEDQKTANERIPLLLETPAAVRGISLEPILGEVDLKNIPVGNDTYINALDGVKTVYSGINSAMPSKCRKLDHVIIGGESGQSARPCSIKAIRNIVEQCKDANVPVFVKQLGSNIERDIPTGLESHFLRITDSKGGNIEEFPEDLRIREFPI